MNTKVNKINSIRPKKTSKRIKKAHEMHFTEKVAHMAGCSTRMVRYVLDEKRNQETATAQRILIAAAIIEEQENKMLEEVKRIVNF